MNHALRIIVPRISNGIHTHNSTFKHCLFLGVVLRLEIPQRISSKLRLIARLVIGSLIQKCYLVHASTKIRLMGFQLHIAGLMN